MVDPTTSLRNFPWWVLKAMKWDLKQGRFCIISLVMDGMGVSVKYCRVNCNKSSVEGKRVWGRLERSL